MVPPELTRREFFDIVGAYGLRRLLDRFRFDPVAPIPEASDYYRREYGVELPIVKHPLLIRIIDQAHPVTDEFLEREIVPNLVRVDGLTSEPYPFGTITYGDNVTVHQLCAQNLMAMASASWYEGYRPYILRGFSSPKTQRLAKYKNGPYSAEPYTSQHHNGLTVDIVSPENNKAIGPYSGYENTLVCRWLHNWAHTWGFVQSYNDGNYHDGIPDEPWHYTYIGTDLAIAHHDLKARGWLGDVFELQSAYDQVI